MDDIEFKLARLSDYSDEAIINEIIRVDNIINKPNLTQKDFSKEARVHWSTIIKRFGSWENALAKAGLQNKYIGGIISEKQKQQTARRLTNEDIIDELKRISKLKGNDNLTLTIEDINANSAIISYSTLHYRFGSLQKALENAGLSVGKHQKYYTNDECFENLLAVWTFHKRQPYYSEINKYPSTVGSKAYVRRWGGWRKALEAFVNKINANEKTGITSERDIVHNSDVLQAKEHKIPAEDRHDIPIGLRFNVLKRDNYKCKICGRSPATDNNVKLHVDHIVAFTNGGKTKIDNLQTLCQDCNLGKSDKEI